MYVSLSLSLPMHIYIYIYIYIYICTSYSHFGSSLSPWLKWHDLANGCRAISAAHPRRFGRLP